MKRSRSSRVAGSALFVAVTAAGLTGCGGSSDDAKSAAASVKTPSGTSTSAPSSATSHPSASSSSRPAVTITKTATPAPAATQAPARRPAAPQPAPAATVIPDPGLSSGYKSCGRVVVNNTSMPVSANSHTSCDFALNTVRDAESGGSININPYSPALGRTVAMTCDIADGAGTCGGGNNAAVAWADGPPTPAGD